MPKEYEKYRIQLIMEYNRVLAWGKAAGLVEVPAGSTIGATLGAEGIELVAIVARIQWLLSEFRELNGRYGNELPQFGRQFGDNMVLDEQPTDADLLQAVSGLALSYENEKNAGHHLRAVPRTREWAMRLGRNTRDIISRPVRVRWIAVDKGAFEALLNDLHALTERLHELMRNHREKQIDDITAKTYREMIMTRDKVQELRDMLTAVTDLVTRSAGIRKEKDAHLNDRRLRHLLKLKILNRLIPHEPNVYIGPEFHNVEIVEPLKFSEQDLAERFDWNEDEVDEPELLRRPWGIIYPPNNRGDILVWIEWKPLGDMEPGSAQDVEATIRTAALANLLAAVKPASMHAPKCVGYFDDRQVSGVARYGWIFQMPPGCDRGTRVRSLHDILGDERYKPSLSQRVLMASRLCETLLDLHAVDWLHKGIFSDNVLFFFFAGSGATEESTNGAGILSLPYDP
jgi:hypothetical protein